MMLIQRHSVEPGPAVEGSRDPAAACWERLAVRLQADLARERDAHAATKRHLERALDLLALHNSGGEDVGLQRTTAVDAWAQTPGSAWDTACPAAEPTSVKLAVETGQVPVPPDDSDLVNQELGLLEVRSV